MSRITWGAVAFFNGLAIVLFIAALAIDGTLMPLSWAMMPINGILYTRAVVAIARGES